MKRILILFFLLVSNFALMAQVPQLFSYEAIVRDNNGTLLTNTNIGLKISILRGSISGSVSYSETHTTSTNENGLVHIQIGGGTPVIGIMDSINWTSNSFYIKTETDPSGGTNYSISGTAQLLTVPYALSAGTADAQTFVSAFPPNNTWGTMTIANTRNKLPKKVTVNYIADIELTLSSSHYPIYCKTEWYDDDRNGLGITYYKSGNSDLGNTNLFASDIILNTNVLGIIRDTYSGITLQTMTISSATDNIIISLSQPVVDPYGGGGDQIIYGNIKVLVYVEW